MNRTVFPLKALFLLLLTVVLAACGGTKVYDTSKTIVYNGSIYQVTDVKQISNRVEAVLGDDNVVNLKNKSRDEVTAMIKENKPLFVRMAFDMDEQELVYAANDVNSWRDYNRLLGRFEDAGDDIAKLMSEKKTEQLKLR